MTATKVTIDRHIQRISALVPDHFPVLAVVVWRNPQETEGEAIERYMREHPETCRDARGCADNSCGELGKLI